MVRDPLHRLGSNGAADVKAHPFFSSIDWDALLRLEIPPPFNPLNFQNAKDSLNFASDITSLPLDFIEAFESDYSEDLVPANTFEYYTYEGTSFIN